MTRRHYPAGVTCWIDHDSADPVAAAAFYGALLGWTTTVLTPPDAPASYAVATLDGEDAGVLAGPVRGPYVVRRAPGCPRCADAHLGDRDPLRARSLEQHVATPPLRAPRPDPAQPALAAGSL